MADKFNFTAIYKIDNDTGQRFWFLELENGQLVTVSDDRVSLFPSKDSDLSKDALGVIERAPKKGDEVDVAEGASTEQNRLL